MCFPYWERPCSVALADFFGLQTSSRHRFACYYSLLNLHGKKLLCHIAEHALTVAIAMPPERHSDALQITCVHVLFNGFLLGGEDRPPRIQVIANTEHAPLNPVGARGEQSVEFAFFRILAPTADHNVFVGVLSMQALAQIARVRQATWTQ